MRFDKFAALDSSELGQQDVGCFCLPIAHSFCEEIWEEQVFVLEAHKSDTWRVSKGRILSDMLIVLTGSYKFSCTEVAERLS